jgi:RNA polymerase sigma-70 factor (ECF subfamily)
MKLEPSEIEALYREVGPLIYARCCRMLKDRATAEDAAQDVFIKLIDRAGDVPAGEARLPWVHRVTVNHCLNVIRDYSRHAQPTIDAELPQLASSDDPEAEVIARDFSKRALQRIPQVLKAPAAMYHQQGMDQSSIAKWLGVSRRTVLYRLAQFSERAQRFDNATAA